MELSKLETKLPSMIMCGDHSSFTKTELNVKEKALVSKDADHSCARVSPVSSKTVKVSESLNGASEQAMRSLEAKRAATGDVSAPTDRRSLLHAALGSFRWPPYLLLVWMVLLLVTHLLHCLLTLLTSSLPHVKRVCHHFRQWTEHTWRQGGQGGQGGQGQPASSKLYPVLLALTTGLLYAVYFAMYAVYSVVLWSIEPLSSEGLHERGALGADYGGDEAPAKTKVTNYLDERDDRDVRESKVKL